jgi:hypothetical protein
MRTLAIGEERDSGVEAGVSAVAGVGGLLEISYDIEASDGLVIEE